MEIMATAYLVVSTMSPYDRTGDIVAMYGDYGEAVEEAIKLRDANPDTYFWVAEYQTPLHLDPV